MASTSAPSLPTIERIGCAAGDIWQLLEVEGPLSINRIINGIDAPRDVVMQALGWLARENKISIADDSRSRVVTLK